MAIEVIRRNQVLKGHIDERGEVPLLASHHGGSLSPAHNDTFLYYLPSYLPLFNMLLSKLCEPACYLSWLYSFTLTEDVEQCSPSLSHS